MLGDRISQHRANINTEEAAKTALILPFISALGYEIANPTEVIPEFTADAVGKRCEKVDYAIAIESEIQILVECKSLDTKLEKKHLAQLYRYFSVTKAKFAILTNGQVFQFYTDLDKTNILDARPFFSLDLTDLSTNQISELEKFEKASFNVEGILANAERLKYVSAVKGFLTEQMEAPCDELVRLVASNVYDGRATATVKNMLAEVTKRAFREVIKDGVQFRLSTALETTSEPEVAETEVVAESGIVTTEEEIQGTLIIKSIVRKTIDVSRVGLRDSKAYCAVLVDNNNRKPLARLHFNGKQKFMSIFDQVEPTRVPLEGLDRIFEFSDRLTTAAEKYAASE